MKLHSLFLCLSVAVLYSACSGSKPLPVEKQEDKPEEQIKEELSPKLVELPLIKHNTIPRSQLTEKYLRSLDTITLMSRDTDGDGLTDYEELFVYGTDVFKIDTDDDGISDYDEIYLFGTDRFKFDTDEDGLSDYDEIFIHNSDPLNPRSLDPERLDGEVIKAQNEQPVSVKGNFTWNVFFSMNGDKLSDLQHAEIDGYLSRFVFGNLQKIIVIGHTDGIGDKKANLFLARRRAHAVAKSILTHYPYVDVEIQAEPDPESPCGLNCDDYRKTSLILVMY